MQVFIGLGSNLGDRARHLETALQALAHLDGVVVLQTSSVIETEPFGDVEQDDFLNQVVLIETVIPPLGLLTLLKQIEKNMGRTVTRHWGPRIIDLDILFYGDLILHDSGLEIPHPGIAEREFVLRSLLELAPDWIHPVTGKTVGQMYDALTKPENAFNSNSDC